MRRHWVKLLFLWLLLCPGAVAAAETAALKAYSSGERFYRAGNLTAARREFARAVQLAPRNQGMRTRLAWLLLELGDPAAARSHFRQLLQQPPAAKDVFLGAALSEQRLGRSEAALAILAAGRRQWPHDPGLLRLQAEITASLPGRGEEALALYQQLQQLEPANPWWPQRRQELTRQVAQQRYQRALASLARNDQIRALQDLAACVQLAPENVGYRTHYAWLLLKTQQPEEAAQHFAKVLAREPNKQDAYLGLALARADQQDIAGAIEAAQTGLARFPQDKALLEILAVQAARQPATRELALATYEQLAALEPGEPQWRRRQADIYLAQGQVNKAERLYKQAVAATPPDPEAALELARLQAEAEAFGLAARYYRLAAAAAPANRQAQEGLAAMERLLRPQLQGVAGFLEDSDNFRRLAFYSGFRTYLAPTLRLAGGYGYLTYRMSNDPSRGRLQERAVHRHVLPLQLHYRPLRRWALDLGAAFNEYGRRGQTAAAQVATYWQITPQTGWSFNYSFHDLIDYYGPFRGPWGHFVEDFAGYGRYRYWVVDPAAFWSQNLFGTSSTQAVTRHIKAHTVSFWGYQNLWSPLTISLYGFLSPISDSNFRYSLGTTLTWRLAVDPLLKVKYSFFYLDYRYSSASLAGLPAGAAALYWDPGAFKNHAWGLVLEKNWRQWAKIALESNLLYTPGGSAPGMLHLAEVNLLLTEAWSFRVLATYLHNHDQDDTSYQLRQISGSLTFRF